MSDDNTTAGDQAEPTTTAAPSPAADAGSSGKFCAYDETHKRFCGPVADTKAKARKAADAPEGHKVTVREV